MLTFDIYKRKLNHSKPADLGFLRDKYAPLRKKYTGKGHDYSNKVTPFQITTCPLKMQGQPYMNASFHTSA